MYAVSNPFYSCIYELTDPSPNYYEQLMAFLAVKTWAKNNKINNGGINKDRTIHLNRLT